jgi:hypothetical protein
MKKSHQRPTEASARPVTPDRRKADLEVWSIDGIVVMFYRVSGARMESAWSL